MSNQYEIDCQLMYDFYRLAVLDHRPEPPFSDRVEGRLVEHRVLSVVDNLHVDHLAFFADDVAHDDLIFELQLLGLLGIDREFLRDNFQGQRLIAFDVHPSVARKKLFCGAVQSSADLACDLPVWRTARNSSISNRRGSGSQRQHWGRWRIG